MVIHVRNIDHKLEEDFRNIVLENFGYHKGNISKAVSEALEYYTYNQDSFKEWIKYRKLIKKKGGPI